MSRRIALFSVIALLAAACGTQTANSLGAPQREPSIGHWLLDSGTDDGADLMILDTHPITMTLSGTRITGTAACNSYGGTYAISDTGGFAITDGIAVTEMWCMDQRVMDLELAFLTALQKVDHLEITSAGLVLTGGGAELRFIPKPGAGDVPPEDNDGGDEPVDSGFFPTRTHGSWTLVSGEIDGRIIPIIDGHPILLTLGLDSFGGTVCNHYGFAEPFPEDGSFPEIASTAMACDDDVMESEATFFEALSRYRSAEVQDGQLMIRGEGTVLLFDPVSTPGSDEPNPGDDPGNGNTGSDSTFPPEADGDWVLSEGELNGQKIPMLAGFPITLTISGLKLSGRVCNEYWGEQGPSGTAGDFATTRMACEQPVMDSEMTYLKALAQGEVAVVDGGRLTIRGSFGYLIFDPA